MSYAFAATGCRSVMRADVKETDGKLDYRVFAHDNTKVGINGAPKTPITVEPSTDGFKYCFTTSTGYWIMRRGGVIAATGNCGMAAVKTNLIANKLPSNLSKIRAALEVAIPVGFNEHTDSGKDSVEDSTKAEISGLMSRFKDLTGKVKDIEGKALKQIGTLGGGNHFIELCLDTENNVWMMLHSGSRNIGKTLAEHHMSIAKTLRHNDALEDRQLAVFLAGTPEMTSYRHDLYWAQDYARINRMVMLDLYKQVLRSLWPSITFDPGIFCHHNYVAEEKHFGEDLFVTRKGAIRAQQGDMGIIPGSMGTKSFIVRGKGNPDSLNSASHGAGRKMSRSKAKAKYTLEDLAEATKGVECRKDQGVLDEIPMAYKSIDRVMENQQDLVEIVATLKQVLCVKG
jgi:tRNA-splicing ligase RtcB